MHEVKWKIRLNTLLYVQCGASKQERFWFESCGGLVASLCGVDVISLCGTCPCTGQRCIWTRGELADGNCPE